MNIGTDAMVGFQNGLVGIADALMYLVALTRLSVELEGNLTSSLLGSHRGVDGQQTETRQGRNVALDAIGVVDGLSQHLITTTNADDGLAIAMGTLDGLRTTVAAQLQQVVERGFRARQDNDVCLFDVFRIISIIKVHARVALKNIKVSKVRNVAQQDHSDIDLCGSRFFTFTFSIKATLSSSSI